MPRDPSANGADRVARLAPPLILVDVATRLITSCLICEIHNVNATGMYFVAQVATRNAL